MFTDLFAGVTSAGMKLIAFFLNLVSVSLAQAEPTKMAYRLHEKTENIFYDRSVLDVSNVDENGVGAILLGHRFSARINVDNHGNVAVKIHDRAQLILDRSMTVAFEEDTLISVKTEPKPNEARYAILHCRLY